MPCLLHIVFGERFVSLPPSPSGDRESAGVGITRTAAWVMQNAWQKRRKNITSRTCAVRSSCIQFFVLTLYLVGAARWGYKIVR